MAAILTVGIVPTVDDPVMTQAAVRITPSSEEDATGVISIDCIRKHIAHIASITVPITIVIAPLDQVTLPAQSSLLKILEDTAQLHTWLLYTHNLGNILPTIQSRCVLVDATIRKNPTPQAQAIAQWIAQLTDVLDVFRKPHTSKDIEAFWQEIVWLCSTWPAPIQKKALTLARYVNTLHSSPQNALDILAIAMAQWNHAYTKK